MIKYLHGIENSLTVTIYFVFCFQIFYRQSVPMGSPLTFTIEGEDSENQIEVGQSAPDGSSPLQVSSLL